MEQSDLDYEVKAEALPLFQASTLSIMKEVIAGTKTPDDAWNEMDSRRKELLVAEKDSKDLVSSLVMQSLGEPLEDTNKFAKVGNDAAAYDRLVEALEAKEAVKSVLGKSGWTDTENFDTEFCASYDKKSVCGFLKFEDRRNLYTIYVRRIAQKADEEGSISEDAVKKLQELQGLLGLDDGVADGTYKMFFGTSLKDAIDEGAKELIKAYNPELQAAWTQKVQEIIANYKLSESMVRSSGRSIYAECVYMIGREVCTS